MAAVPYNNRRSSRPAPVKINAAEQLELDIANKALLAKRAAQIKAQIIKPAAPSEEKQRKFENWIYSLAAANKMSKNAADKLIRKVNEWNAKARAEGYIDPREIQRKAELDAYKNKQTQNALFHSRIPIRFFAATLEADESGQPIVIEPRNQRAHGLMIRLRDGWCHGHKGLTLSGPAGCGKTYLALSVLVTLIKRHGRDLYGRIVTEREYLSLLRNAYDRSATDPNVLSAGEVVEQFVRRPQFLILDDIGAADVGDKAKTDWARGQLLDLVEYRSSHGLTTVYTTNLQEREMVSRYGERFVSRMTGRSPWIEIGGIDYRQRTPNDSVDPFADGDPFE